MSRARTVGALAVMPSPTVEVMARDEQDNLHNLTLTIAQASALRRALSEQLRLARRLEKARLAVFAEWSEQKR